LPAVGLETLGPSLIAVVAVPEPAGDSVLQIYDDLGGRPLSGGQPVEDDVEAAIDAIARVHTAFAEHALLAECRLWGGDRGISFYSANLRDAIIALRSLDLDALGAAPAGRALVERIDSLQRQEPERARVMAAAGGPDTLLHGDLWPENAVVVPNGDDVSVRLVDWDEAGVGPIGFDLSTFLLRFDSSRRPWILDCYREAVGRHAGWRLPDERELNLILETAAQARLASLLVWSIAAASQSDAGWLPERLAGIVEWLDDVEPVLPR
jgi:hypothetical protein